jgi:hypothetical protein
MIFSTATSNEVEFRGQMYYLSSPPLTGGDQGEGEIKTIDNSFFPKSPQVERNLTLSEIKTIDNSFFPPHPDPLPQGERGMF